MATRSGRQRPPEPNDGNWAQTVIADDWDELETELTAQARYDAERLSSQAAHALQYQAGDTGRPYSCISFTDRIGRLVEPADDARRGGLADLVRSEYPDIKLSDMTLAPVTRAQLERVLHEQRQRDLLEAHGFAPTHRLLLTGPAGTGKSMTASALATELSLRLVTIGIEALISKYTGEAAAKLRVIFDAMAGPRTVYLFDDLDAIGARPMAGFEFDIVDARRILSMYLSFLDDTQPESLVVTVTDHRSLLDDALLRRFDAVIAYYLPDPAQAVEVLRRRLGAINTSEVSWNEVGDHVKGLSQASLVRTAESAAKRAILDGGDSLSTADLITSLGELRNIHHVMGFGRTLPR